MKRNSCINLKFFGFSIACIDIILALSTIGLCSLYLYNDFMRFQYWALDEVQVSDPFTNFITTGVNYVLVHNFSSQFYMVLAVTLWVKSFINFVVAAILVDGIKKERLFSIAPWIINTMVSIFIEVMIFIFMEIKIDEADASLDKRVIRIIIFGIFIVINALFTFVIIVLYKLLSSNNNENLAIQESIAESSEVFQHIKV